MYCKQCGIEISDMSLKKCPNCNTTIGKGGRFCENCGKKLAVGEKCDCVKNKEQEQITNQKDTKIPISGSDFENAATFQKNNLNKRISNNPLLSKIANSGEDISKSNKILKEEAVKMVYGKEALKEFNKEVAAPIVEPPEKPSVLPVQPYPVSENKERVNKKIKEPTKKNPVEKSTINSDMISKTTENMGDKTLKNTSESLFPEAFNDKNLEIASLTPEPVKKEIYNQGRAVKDKKTFDVFWPAAMLMDIFAMFMINKLLLSVICIVFSLVFSIIDTIVNKRKTGLGIIFAIVIQVIIFVINILI